MEKHMPTQKKLLRFYLETGSDEDEIIEKGEESCVFTTEIVHRRCPHCSGVLDDDEYVVTRKKSREMLVLDITSDKIEEFLDPEDVEVDTERMEQAQPGQDRPTFWTGCPSCNMKFQYYNDMLNKALRCVMCLKISIANDLNLQGVPLGIPRTHPVVPQQLEASQNGRITSSQHAGLDITSDGGFQRHNAGTSTTVNRCSKSKGEGYAVVGGSGKCCVVLVKVMKETTPVHVPTNIRKVAAGTGKVAAKVVGGSAKQGTASPAPASVALAPSSNNGPNSSDLPEEAPAVLLFASASPSSSLCPVSIWSLDQNSGTKFYSADKTRAVLKGPLIFLSIPCPEYNSRGQDEVLPVTEPASTVPEDTPKKSYASISSWTKVAWYVECSHNNNNSYPYLKTVYIWSSPHSSLPKGFNKLKGIQILDLFQCATLDFELKELNHLTMLQHLDINYCPILKERLGEGRDWSILSHVPKITIDGKKITKSN
ncbi:hypothetical protein IFM89_008306 [Coptis chinensis]|uniref:Uncharacterized protein n=1 Tax=Coptis chinensis TaxID=261450 RepID=A0A835IAV4_9MAGN|nr:hypothetical protein IFM89_008306 [Coptis chinensis]